MPDRGRYLIERIIGEDGNLYLEISVDITEFSR
jgi:hypothetical protein